MDLVPAYLFNDFWVSDREISASDSREWHAVPKPSKSENCEMSRSFITSYAKLERDKILNLNNFKTLIRFFKKLRDKKNWIHLKSYYIKTVFLHHNEEMKANDCYWKQPLHVLFLIVSIKV